MSLKARYFKNSFYNVSGWIWLVLLNIVTVPYMVHQLGYDEYGILALVVLVLGYFSFLDFGLGEAVIKYLAHYHALAETQKMNRIINSILFLFIIIGIFGAAAIAVFTKFFALKIFKIPLPLQQTALICFYLSGLGFFLNLIFGAIAKIPEAMQRFELSNRNNVIIGTLVTLSSVVIVALGWRVKEVVAANIFGSLLGIYLFYRTARRLIPELYFNLRFHYADFREIFQFGIFTVFTKFSSLITDSVSQLFVSSLVGTSGLTIFNVPFKLVTRFQALVYRIAFIAFPASSELYANENLLKLHRMYLKLSGYIFLLSSILFIPLIAYARKILLFWMGADFAARGTYTMVMACIAFYFASFTMIPGLVALGFGKPKYNAIFSSLTAVLNIVLGFPLTKAWGINGAATALLLSVLHFPFDIFMINKKIITIDGKKYFISVFGKNLIFIICILLFYTYGLSRMMVNPVSFVAVLLASYALLFWFFYKQGLTGEDREFLTRTLRGITAKLY